MSQPASRIDHERVAHAWLHEPENIEGRLRYYQGSFYRFNGQSFGKLNDEGVFAELTRFAAAHHVEQELRVSIPVSYLHNVLNTVKAHTIVSAEQQMPCWLGEGPTRHYLSFSNGLVERSALLAGNATVEPHTPEWFSVTNVLPFAYQPEATCPGWLAFLDEVLEHDAERINVLQEWFGYCLSPDTSRHKFLLLEGAGSNGKSVIVNVLEGLLGHANVSSVPVESFADRFALSSTIGKLLNTCSEASKVSPRIEGLLKQFVGGDLITVDRKHIDPLQFRPTARLVITTNKRPPFSDNSDGIWRRMLALPFNVQITEDRQIPNYDKRLLEDASGILNWSIEGLRRLQQRGRFSQSAVMADTVKRFRAEDAPDQTFLKEHFREWPDAETQAAEVYHAYLAWAQHAGEKPSSLSEFGKLIRRTFPNVESYQAKTGKLRDTRIYRNLQHRRNHAEDITPDVIH